MTPRFLGQVPLRGVLRGIAAPRQAVQDESLIYEQEISAEGAINCTAKYEGLQQAL